MCKENADRLDSNFGGKSYGSRLHRVAHAAISEHVVL